MAFEENSMTGSFGEYQVKRDDTAKPHSLHDMNCSQSSLLSYIKVMLPVSLTQSIHEDQA